MITGQVNNTLENKFGFPSMQVLLATIPQCKSEGKDSKRQVSLKNFKKKEQIYLIEKKIIENQKHLIWCWRVEKERILL